MHVSNNLVFVAILVSFTACNKDKGAGETPADTTSPTIANTTPAASAAERSSVITATFDEDIFAKTVDDTSFTLDQSGAVNGTVTFDALTNVASFMPSRDLAVLTTYTASLSTAITDISGNPLTSNYDWSFTTADGTWGRPELIELDNISEGITPKIAFDNSGNALTVWGQYDGTRYNIWSNRFDGTSWDVPELIESDNAGYAVEPKIVFDNAGNALSVWHQSDGTRNNIWSNRFDGTSWGTAELIESNNSGAAQYPQLAFDQSGNALSVWHQSSGGLMNIWSNRFDGTNWGTAELVQTNTGVTGQYPQIAFDGSGNALSVWEQHDGVRYSIWSSRYNGTSWGTPELIETEDDGSAYYPQIGFDGIGNALAIWSQYDGTLTNVWSNRFNGSSWGTAELIEASSVGNSSIPQIAVDDSGVALAVWPQSDGTRFNIWANRFDGTSWGTAELIETEDLGNAEKVQIDIDDRGNALVVWDQFDGSRYNIWSNRFNGTSWGTAELIETRSAGHAKAAQVAIDGSGSGIAVWYQSDGFRNNIWVNHFK